jgi:hypothetical protein
MSSVTSIVRRQKTQMLAEYLLDLEQLFPSYPVCTGPVNVQALYTSADLIRQYAKKIEDAPKGSFCLTDARKFEEFCWTLACPICSWTRRRSAPVSSIHVA